jgi:hypothetical protein
MVTNIVCRKIGNVKYTISSIVENTEKLKEILDEYIYAQAVTETETVVSTNKEKA